jgi:hypothetical protein
MRARQRGLLPVATLIIGYGMMLYCGLAALFGLQAATTRLAASSTISSWSSLIPLAGVLLLFVAFVFAGFGIAGVFPSITVTEAALKVRYALLITSSIKWDQIQEVAEIGGRNQWSAIILARPRSSLLFPGRLYFNYLYGFLIGRARPAILVSGGLENREKLVTEIRSKITK